MKSSALGPAPVSGAAIMLNTSAAIWRIRSYRAMSYRSVA